MTELRQKMIRAMEIKNLSPHTQRAYLAAVTGHARHYRQSPVAITKEMISFTDTPVPESWSGSALFESRCRSAGLQHLSCHGTPS